MKKSNTLSLLEGDIGPHLWRLSVPLTFGMLAVTAYTLADAYFIARLGTQVLAAFGFTLPVTAFATGVAYGLSVGTASVLSRTFGEGDMDRLRQTSTDTLVLSALIFSVVAVIGISTIDLVFPLLGAGKDTMPHIRSFMLVWYLGLPAQGLMIVSNACMRATGDTRYPSAMMIFVAVACILLGAALIFGIGPFPAMGMTGAALAFALVHGGVLLCALYYLARRRGVLSPHLWHAQSRYAWKRILHVALPTMLSNFVMPISAAVITWMAAGFGKEAVAAYGIATRIEGGATLFFYSVASGVSIFSGQNYGAGNFGRIAEACRIGQGRVLAIGGIIALLLLPFAREIARVFDTNELVVAYATTYMHWVPVSFGAMGTLSIVIGTLNAMGKPLWATGLIFARVFLLTVPLAYILHLSFGFGGIVAALVVANCLSGVAAYVVRRSLIR